MALFEFLKSESRKTAEKLPYKTHVYFTDVPKKELIERISNKKDDLSGFSILHPQASKHNYLECIFYYDKTLSNVYYSIEKKVEERTIFKTDFYHTNPNNIKEVMTRSGYRLSSEIT